MQKQTKIISVYFYKLVKLRICSLLGYGRFEAKEIDKEGKL